LTTPVSGLPATLRIAFLISALVATLDPFQ